MVRYTANSLMWGSFRLAPIRITACNYIIPGVNTITQLCHELLYSAAGYRAESTKYPLMLNMGGATRFLFILLGRRE